MVRATAALMIGVLASPAVIAAPEESPLVEILESRGIVDAPSATNTAPRWDRIQLELHIKNRLAAEITELEVELTLVSPDGKELASLIPGWRFEHRFEDAAVQPMEEIILRIDRPLPAQRRALPADLITYRATIQGYRVVHPTLNLATTLLESSAKGDQRAAFRSYQGREASEGLVNEIREALDATQLGASPSKALRLLFALQVASGLYEPSLVEPLLELAATPPEEGWNAALYDLGSRMVAASQADDPRLRILPKWARSDPSTLESRGSDALMRSIRDAIVGMGDIAVPDLMRHASRRADPAGALALSLLHAMGRSTTRLQLSIPDRATQIRVIEVLGEQASADQVPQLAELMTSRDKSIRLAAKKALVQIGPEAIPALIAALGTPEPRAQEPILEALVSIGERGRNTLISEARRFGVSIPAGSRFKEAVQLLARRLSVAAAERYGAEIERALVLGREGRYDESLRVLDRIYQRAPALYMKHGKEIARIYYDRAQRLYVRGNYDAALKTLRLGGSVYELKEAGQLTRGCLIALARGYLEAGELSMAEGAIKELTSSPNRSQEIKDLEALYLARRASAAVSMGEYGRARALIDRARAASPGSEEIEDAHRKLLLFENLAVVLVLSLLVPAAFLVLMLALRKKMQAQKMKRLEVALEKES